MSKKQVLKLLANKPIIKVLKATQYYDCWKVIAQLPDEVVEYIVYDNGDIFKR